MEYLNDLNDNDNDNNQVVVLPINQLEGTAAITIELSAIQDQHHPQGSQLKPQTTEALIVPGGVHLPVQVQQMTPVDPQQLQFEDDIVVVEPEIAEPGCLSIQIPVDANGILEPLIRDPQSNSTCLEIFILGHNRSIPIWRLRLICAICIVFAMVGIVFNADDLFQANKTPSQLVKLIIMVVAPIVVAVISVVGSFTSNPDKWENCITGLIVANVSILVGQLACLFGLRRQVSS